MGHRLSKLDFFDAADLAAGSTRAWHFRAASIREREALSQLSANPAAGIYVGFDKHLELPKEDGAATA